MAIGDNGGFLPAGLERRGWATSEPIRGIFRRAFAAAALPYFNPHSFRDMLVHHAMALDLTPWICPDSRAVVASRLDGSGGVWLGDKAYPIPKPGSCAFPTIAPTTG